MSRFFKGIWVGVVLFSLSACVGIEQPVVQRVELIPSAVMAKPKPPSPQVAVRADVVKPVSLLLSRDRQYLQTSGRRLWGGVAQEKHWALITLKAIDQHGGDLLLAEPGDIQDYCPNYSLLSHESRRFFWLTFVSSLARFESNYDPTAFHQERFNDVQGNPVVSRGLLQVSIESGNGYGCALQTADELHNPARNLVCAVRILNRWVGQRDGVIVDKEADRWKGAARYWSPFRNQTKRQQIAQETASLPMCRRMSAAR